MLPSYTEDSTDKKKYCEAFNAQTREQNAVRGTHLLQPQEKARVLQPAARPLSTKEWTRSMPSVYAQAAPVYRGHIPALEEVSFSVTSARGCFGNCNFCALTFHQGRVVTGRSHASILVEAEKMTWDPDFKGYIHDVGGPTANFRHPACEKQLKSGVCADRHASALRLQTTRHLRGRLCRALAKHRELRA